MTSHVPGPGHRQLDDVGQPTEAELWRDILADADGLLVDLDGTLVDSTAPVTRAWHAFAARHGLDGDLVHHWAQGRPSRETVEHFAPPQAHAREAAQLEADEVSDTSGVVALPGAAALLARTVPLAIVTSCSRALARARLAAAGLPEPPHLITSDMVSRGKPDPEGYRLGAARLGIDPARAVVLEDAPAGITAGRAAGARVIALRTTHADDALADADAVVDDLAALLSG